MDATQEEDKHSDGRSRPACCFGRPLPPRTLRLEVHDQRERQSVVRLLQRDVNTPGR